MRILLIAVAVSNVVRLCGGAVHASQKVRPLRQRLTFLQHRSSPLISIDPKEWKQVTTALVFQGASLSNCYKAFDATTYEMSKEMLIKKLGAKIDILYMTCGTGPGSATPEWKFLQRDGRDAYTNSLVQEKWQEQDVGPFPCLDNPSAAGCPTKPPVMFPYTPTATLTVEITGSHSEVQKAMQEAEKADFCFDAANDVAVCTEWMSGSKCCMVAQPTQPPPNALLTPPSYNPR